MIGRVAAITLLTACASATAPSGGSPEDAPVSPKIDAPDQLPPVDAPHVVPMDAPMTTQVCTTSATCAAPTVLSPMGGDEDGGGSTNQSGYQAAWFSVRLSETDSGPFGDPMSINTTLTSPAGASFDLFVYVDTSNDDVDCTTPTGTVTTSGSTETSNIEWGETGTFANNSDDSRTVSIEVRPTSGDNCSAASTWSLSIETGID